MTSINHSIIRICRVYTPPETKKGAWILVDRLWPRGLKKETLAFDLWLKDIAPSVPLRRWFHEHPEERWHEFVSQYIQELKNKASLMEQIRATTKQHPVTLFYAAKDKAHNHALILREFLYSWPNIPSKLLFH